ncbi:MAG: 50S ribosomal protein L4 [Oscillospiraceae bacterium]|jgi:large subunit ribosomal protein L4|nr:50S ribosomal protein L4 [Oscillospiraceae bacterium]
MPKANVYDMSGAQTGECELSEGVFGIEPNRAALHEMVRHHLAARRQGTQSTLTRSEVSGGGAKPWRQKGTGRARHGSTRSPQWTHGGVALGPKPRSYRYSVNKKVRRLAIRSALSAKAAAGEILIIEDLRLDAVKTKTFAAFLRALPVQAKRSLVVIPEPRESVILSARNIPGVKTTLAGIINVYDLLGHGVLILDRAAVTRIEEVYAQ